MAYRRRYFEPFTGTTETIVDNAITKDKIASKAVGSEELADDAVTTEKIADGEVRSEDIGTGQVKSSDLAAGAVTVEKIADGAVTSPKLADTVAIRPLTPAATTSEIADGAVTLPKLATDSVDASKIKAGGVGASELAGEAVETAKVKDANITGPKIAASAIDNTHIKADAVRGTEIQDGAVSVGKIGADAVETAKIKDRNVTTAKIALLGVTPAELAVDAVETAKIKDKAVTVSKLADDLFADGLATYPFFYDEFVGAVLDNRWAQAGVVGGSANILDKALCEIKTGASENDEYRIDWNGKKAYIIDTMKPVLIVLVNSNDTIQLDIFFGFYRDDNNFYGFRLRSAVSNNWYAVCKAGGVETAEDTGVNSAGGAFACKVEWLAVDSVKFYINNVLKNTITTDVPTGDMEFRGWVENLALSARALTLKYVGISAIRV